MYDPNEFRPRRLYRDTRKGKVAGVFAGIAEYMGFRVCATRIGGIVLMLMFMPIGIIAYFLAAIVLQPMPENAYSDPVEEHFVRAIRKSPGETFSSVRYRFKNIESRLQKMERYVTSSRFNLDREFDELRRQ